MKTKELRAGRNREGICEGLSPPTAAAGQIDTYFFLR